MKLKHLFLLFFIWGAFYLSLNYEKVQEVVGLLKGKETEFGNSSEDVYNDLETLESQLPRSNKDSNVRVDLASDGQITYDEALDIVEDYFSGDNITLESASFIDENDEVYLCNIRSYTENSTTTINTWWTVNKSTGEISSYDSDVLSDSSY